MGIVANLALTVVLVILILYFFGKWGGDDGASL